MDLIDKYLNESKHEEIAKIKKELKELKSGKLNPRGKKRVQQLIDRLVSLGDFSEI